MKARVQDSRIVQTLQDAVNTELAVSQHYWSRAVYWRNLGVEKLAEMYAKEADEERGHAKLVSDRMAFLGVQPSMQPGYELPTHGTLREQFTEDLQGEVTVANTYTSWVQEAQDKQDFVTYEILLKILRETEEHADYLQGQLAVADQIGDALFLARWTD
jgi:bacterioferritin